MKFLSCHRRRLLNAWFQQTDRNRNLFTSAFFMTSSEESTKRSTCLHNKFNTFAKGNQKAPSTPFRFKNQRSMSSETKVSRDSNPEGLDRVQQYVKQMHGLFSKQTSPLVYTALPSLVYTLPLHYWMSVSEQSSVMNDTSNCGMFAIMYKVLSREHDTRWLWKVN